MGLGNEYHHWERDEKSFVPTWRMSKGFKQGLGRDTAAPVEGTKVTGLARILAAQGLRKNLITDMNTGAESWA